MFAASNVSANDGAGDNCFFVADKGNYPDDDDLLARTDIHRGGSGPINEDYVDFTGTIDVEALAVFPPDETGFEVWAVDHDLLGKLDTGSAAFTPINPANRLGSGDGSLGHRSFGNADGLAFDRSTSPATLYATIRDEEEPDLLIQVDPNTGLAVPDAFGAGVDYVAVEVVGDRQNVDDIVFDNSSPPRLLSITNERGGHDSHLTELDKNTGNIVSSFPMGQIVDPVVGRPDDIEALTLGTSGLWGMNGKNLNGTNSSYVWEVEPDGTTTNPRLIGDGARDWEGFGCLAVPIGPPECISELESSNARAFGLRADLLGGGLLPATPDIGPTPDSDVTNPDQLLAIPNVLDATAPPLVSLLSVSEEQIAGPPSSATATATTAAVDLFIPALPALRVQADAVKAQSTSYGEVGGASSSSAGSTIANLRIGGTQYGDVSEPLTVVINDPLNPGSPFIEVHVLERIRRDAAAGIVQPFPGLSKSGLDVNGIHVVVHDLAATTFLNEATDIIVAHASTDIAFVTVRPCPSLSGRAFSAQLLNVKPDLANGMVGEVILPSTGGQDAEHLADVDVGTLLTADAASTTTTGGVTSLEPDSAVADSRAVVAEAALSTLLTAKLIEATAHAECSSPIADPRSCSIFSVSGDTVIADVDILGTDVCSALGLTATCHPAPNTPFIDIPGVLRVVLNEQIPDADARGITVNAIHIWVLGSIPGSTLPVGAEVIISSAHADAHPACPPVGTPGAPAHCPS